MRTKLPAILACILWGSAFAGAKIGFTYTTPLHLSGMRFTLAGILLIPFLIYQKTDWKANLKQWKYMLFFGILQTFIQYGLFFMGLDKVPAAVSAIIIGGGPLFVAVMAHFTIKNDKLGLRKVIAILLGMTGIVFISTTKGTLNASNNTFYLGYIPAYHQQYNRSSYEYHRGKEPEPGRSGHAHRFRQFYRRPHTLCSIVVYRTRLASARLYCRILPRMDMAGTHSCRRIFHLVFIT